MIDMCLSIHTVAVLLGCPGAQSAAASAEKLAIPAIMQAGSGCGREREGPCCNYFLLEYMQVYA